MFSKLFRLDPFVRRLLMHRSTSVDGARPARQDRLGTEDALTLAAQDGV